MFLQPQLLLRTEYSLPQLLELFIRPQFVSYGEQCVSVIKTNPEDIITVYFFPPDFSRNGNMSTL